MDVQKATTQYRLSKWAKITQAQHDSGQNINEFCQTEGISKSQYFYWQRKLKNAALEELALQAESVSPTQNRWIQLAPVQAQQTKAELKIEISGFHINVDKETDPELLKKVCRVLGSLQ
jgi:putative transposase